MVRETAAMGRTRASAITPHCIAGKDSSGNMEFSLSLNPLPPKCNFISLFKINLT